MEVALQAYLGVIVHIAFDAGLIHSDVVRLMSECTRILSNEGATRSMLAGQ
jgi:hypothetical protein